MHPYFKEEKPLHFSLLQNNNENRPFVWVFSLPNTIWSWMLFQVNIQTWFLYNIPIPELDMCPVCEASLQSNAFYLTQPLKQVGTVWTSNLNLQLVSAAVFGNNLFQESFQKLAKGIKRQKTHPFPQQFVPGVFTSTAWLVSTLLLSRLTF